MINRFVNLELRLEQQCFYVQDNTVQKKLQQEQFGLGGFLIHSLQIQYVQKSIQ